METKVVSNNLEKSNAVSVVSEESKEDFDKENVKLDGKEAGEGFLDLTNGNYGFTHTDTFGIGEVLDISVAHIFDSNNKTSEEEVVTLNDGSHRTIAKGGLGDGFRTNYNQFLIKDETGVSANDDISERFIYVDGKGKKHIFEEKYFYKKDGLKEYVQKELVTIDQDKNLWFENNGTKYKVEKEVTDGKLKLVAKLDDFKGLNKIDTEIEEIVQVKSQIKEMRAYIESCNKQKYFNKKREYLLGETKTLNEEQKTLQEQSLASELVDLNDQKVLYEDYQKWVDYYGDAYTDQVDMRTYANVGQEGQPDTIEESHKINLNSYQRKLRETNYNAMWRYALDGENDSREKRIRSLNGANKTFVENSATLNQKQHNFQKEQIVYENKQLDLKIAEYKLMLEKKIQELKELERQVPVHYIVDENGNFLGFGKINPASEEDGIIFRLIVIGDNYENTIFISYDENAEGNRIIAITHSNNKQIDFEYENDKLVKIINFDGKETKFEYDTNNKLTQIMNGDELSTFEYATNGDLISVMDNNGDGFKMVFGSDGINIADTTKYNFVNNDGGIDNGGILEYNKCNVVINGMSTILTDEKGNAITYTFNSKGETVSVVKTNANGEVVQKEFEYIGGNCTFTAEAFSGATEYYITKDTTPQSTASVIEYEVQNIAEIKESGASEFVFSAFATATSNEVERSCSMHDKGNITNNTRFELRAEIEYEGEEPKLDIQYCSFDWKNKGKQYLAFPVSLDLSKTLVGIKLIFNYSFNNGTATIEGMSFKEGSWVHKKFNVESQVTEIKTSNGEVETLTYDDKKRLVKATLVKNNEIKIATFEYNKYGELIRTTDYNGIVIEKEFNENGELIKTSKYNKNEPATRLVEETILDEKGREVKLVNELGEEVKDDGVSVTNADGTAVEISSAVDGEANNNVLTYTKGLLTKVEHNGFDWGYTYDYKKRLTKVDLANETYLIKEYNDTVSTTTTTLANNEKFINTLDNDGNVIKVEYENEGIKEPLVENKYKNGKLIEIIENHREKTEEEKTEIVGIKTTITYDKFGNVKETNGTQNGKVFIVSGEYDEDKIKSKSVTIDNEVKTTNFAYDSQDRLSSVELPSGKTQTLTYDGLGRVKAEKVGEISKNISYVKKNERTCELVASVDYAIKDKTASNTKYVYDKFGNITEIRENGKLVNRYEYDSIGRLVREDNRALNKTITYEYDKGGNIRRRFEHLFTLDSNEKLEEITCILKKEENNNISWDSPKITDLEYDYCYKTNGNNDQILEYCGKAFKYDKIGNPEVYMDKALKFEKGRQLVELNDTAKKLNFTYNANGLRTSKTEESFQTGNTFITDYYLDGKNIVREERFRKYDNGTETGGKSLVRTIDYTYGASGLVGFSIKNDTDEVAKEYLYIKNIQGDIIGIVDLDGNEIAKYDYSAFGKQKVSYKQNGSWVEITNDGYNDDKNYAVAVANPFRYRGYYFDQETNLYYLRSRYYDAELGRFVTIDDISYIDTETINGINLYAYCGNNPVMCIDDDGDKPKWWQWLLFGAIALVAVGAIIGGAIISGGSILPMLVGGALMGSGIGFLGSAGANIVSQGLNNGFNNIDLGKAFLSGGIGAGVGAISGLFSSAFGYIGKDLGKFAGTYLSNTYVLGHHLSKVYGFLGGGRMLIKTGTLLGKVIGLLFGGAMGNEIANNVFGKNPSLDDNMKESSIGLIQEFIFHWLGKFKWLS